jgi:hypothetical protein
LIRYLDRRQKETVFHSETWLELLARTCAELEPDYVWRVHGMVELPPEAGWENCACTDPALLLLGLQDLCCLSFEDFEDFSEEDERLRRQTIMWAADVVTAMPEFDYESNRSFQRTWYFDRYVEYRDDVYRFVECEEEDVDPDANCDCPLCLEDPQERY